MNVLESDKAILLLEYGELHSPWTPNLWILQGADKYEAVIFSTAKANLDWESSEAVREIVVGLTAI